MSKFAVGQYFNAKGVDSFFRTLLYSRQNLKPHIKTKSILNINFPALHQKGIRFVIFDKDNTLTLPYSLAFPNSSFKQQIKICNQTFTPDNVAILSNSAGSRDDKLNREAHSTEEALSLRVMIHKDKKPDCLPDITRHFIRCDDLSEICVIGDRVLSDVVMGRQYGCLTILVDPIDQSKDNFMVKQVRKFENYLESKIDTEYLGHSFIANDEFKDLLK